MAKEKKRSSIVKEFKEFALQGNLFDMAVGVLIGGVFKDLVTSFTNNIIMPIISIFTGSIDFSAWKVQVCRPWFPFNLFVAPKAPKTKILVFHGQPDPDQAIVGYNDGKAHHKILPAPWIETYWQL